MRKIEWSQRLGKPGIKRHYCCRYVQGVETLLDAGIFDAVMTQVEVLEMTHVEVPRPVTIAQIAAT